MNLANTKTPGGVHRNVDISNWPKDNVLRYWSMKENWKGGQGGYAVTKLLQQYAVNEIAKLALKTDGKYAIPRPADQQKVNMF